MAILDELWGQDPILVRGRSVNVWAQHHAGRHPVLRDTSRFVRKDVDLFDDMSAARKLAGSLEDGRILLPGPGKAGRALAREDPAKGAGTGGGTRRPSLGARGKGLQGRHDARTTPIVIPRHRDRRRWET